jgi:hypothetical protein
MPFDQNNNFLSTQLGKDRLGHTTPDCDASEPIQPFLPKSYPAPWLPSKRRDDAHPAGINVAISHANIVGVDKNGYLIPAGLFSGNTGVGGDYCLVKYSSEDLALGTTNPKTGVDVAAAGAYVLLAAPSEDAGAVAGVTADVDGGSLNSVALTEAQAGDADDIKKGTYVSFADTVGVYRVASRSGLTLVLETPVVAAVAAKAVSFAVPSILGVTPTGDDITWARTCDLIPGGVARGLGYALRNMWQNLVLPDVASTTNGINYNCDMESPTKKRITNYQPEPGNAIRTTFVLRMPWIGPTPDYLAKVAAVDGVTGYTQTEYSKSFTHFTGVKGNAAGQLFQGCLVVPSTAPGDAGNYTAFDPAKHSIDQVVGRVIGIQQAFPIKDYANRVRTQFERSMSFKGAFSERNAVTGLMGGSATRGIPYQVSLGTNGLFRAYVDQGKAGLLVDAAHEPLFTTVLVMITLC